MLVSYKQGVIDGYQEAERRQTFLIQKTVEEAMMHGLPIPDRILW